LDKLANINNN